MFLSPDPFLQAPEQWLNYNRYAYVTNNPMLYIDPSGYRHKTAQEREHDAIYQSYMPEVYWEGRRSFGGGGGFYSAYMQARFNGYTGDVSDFQSAYDKQVNSPNFNGKINLKYEVGFFFDHSNAGGGFNGVTLPELNKVWRSITVDLWKGSGANHGERDKDPNFHGLPIVFLPETETYSEYLDGKIKTRKSTYLKALNGKLFDLTTLRHEYGHYLQEKLYGDLYALFIGIESSVSYTLFIKTGLNDGIGLYQNSRSEIEANTLAFVYFGSPEKWDMKNYPIDYRYIKK